MFKKEHVHMILNGDKPQTINQLMDMSISLYRSKQAVRIYDGKKEIKISFEDFYQEINRIQNTFTSVKNACLNVSDTNCIIIHSYLGSQYTSDLFEHYIYIFVFYNLCPA